MLKPHRKPYCYRELLVWKKAEDLQKRTQRLTRFFPKTKTLVDRADQMNRSARSGKQNIAEGWKRNTTKEYFDFLGFSLAAVAELEEDCDDIISGIFPELEGIKGVVGERGEMGQREFEMGRMGERGAKGGKGETGKIGRASCRERV